MIDEYIKKNYFITFSLFVFSNLILLVGGSLYLLFRSHNLEMFYWLRTIKLEQFFYQHDFNSTSKLISFCVYSLPNGLWLLSAVIFFWSNLEKRKRYIFLLFIFIFVSKSFV